MHQARSGGGPSLGRIDRLDRLIGSRGATYGYATFTAFMISGGVVVGEASRRDCE